MQTKLISIPDLIKEGWELYTENFSKYLIPILIILGPYLLFYIAQIFLGPSAVILILALTALIIFINIWGEIAIIQIVNKIYNHQPVDINNILESSFQKIPSLVLIGLMLFVITMGGLILFIIPGIIFAIWYVFAQYINILEEKNNKGLTALKSSKELVKGRWSAIFWRILLPNLFVIFFVFLITFGISFLIANGQDNPADIQQSLLLNAITSFILLLLIPLFASFNVILYNNLKASKKSANIE